MSNRMQAQAAAPKASSASVSRAVRPSITPVRTALLQRACACGQLPGSGGKCDDCDKKEKGKVLQRASNGGAQPATVPAVVNQTLSSPGHPLDTSTRTFMESRFGHDFGSVRVHNDSLAAESARAVNAKAYTVGNDVVFDRGQYNPSTQSGRHLLAHELAHTVQQGGVHRYANDLRVGGAMDSHLEREADSVAQMVVGGPTGTPSPIVPVPSRLGGPILSRAENESTKPPDPQEAADEPVRSWEDIPASDPLSKICTQQSKLRPGVINPKIRAYKVKEPLPLPNEKGPVSKLWQQRAAAGALESVIDATDRPKSVLKQERPDTDALRKIWLTRVGWTKENAASNWQSAGGDKLTTFEPRAGKNICEMDHVIELQIGGNNTTENILPLDREENGASGRGLFQYLKGKGDEIRTLTKVDQVILHFDNVAQAAPICNICCQIAQKADSMALAASEAKAKAGVEEAEPYEIKAGVSTTLQLPLGTTAKRKSNPTVRIADSENPKNKAASTLVPGMILETLNLKAKGNDDIDAYIDTTNEKTRLPITIDKVKGKERSVNLTVTDARELKLSKRSEHPKIAFTFPYLSNGTITDLNYDPAVGLSGAGKIKPSIPLLNKLELGIAFSPTEFKITAGIDPKKITPPFPGLKIKDPELALIYSYSDGFKAKGGFGYELSKGSKKVIYGEVEIKTDGSVIVATGSVKAAIPGVDEEKSKGDVTYQGGAWSGVIHVESTDIKLPGIKKGRVDAGFTNKGVTGGGELDLEIPGGHAATVGLKYAGDHWEFRGKGVFKIPKLDDTTVYISYDGEKFYGEGETGFKFYGFKGKFKVKFAAKAGAERARIWGEGSLDFEKGRAKGRLEVKLNEKGKFSGAGSVTFLIKEGMTATGGIVIDENEKVTISGGLTFPPYPLFPLIPEDQKPIDIFKIKPYRIPVPFLSFGPFGLKAQIRAGVIAAYGIGPGELRHGYIKADFNPLEEHPDFDLEAGGQLYIPGFFRLTAYVAGGLVLDVFIAEAGGEIILSASLSLKADVNADLKMRYSSKEGFSAKGDLAMNLLLKLLLCLSAHAWASAGVWKFKVTTGKTWNLAAFPFVLGSIGVKSTKPLSYSSVNGLELPEFGFTDKPQFDGESAVKGAFGNVTGNESDGKPDATSECPKIPDE